jgi:hypothetical protein
MPMRRCEMTEVLEIYSDPDRRWVGDGFPARTLFSYARLATGLTPSFCLISRVDDLPGGHGAAAWASIRMAVRDCDAMNASIIRGALVAVLIWVTITLATIAGVPL